jgi:molybdopterin-guanine dinucleotide biosynthesis protein A
MLASRPMRIPMPAAVLIGGASRRMGRPKAALAYGAGTLAEFQVARLSEIFEDVFLVAKEKPAFPVGPSRVVLDGASDHAAIHGLVRALEEVPDRVFVLAVDLPAIPNELVRLIAARGLTSPAAAVLPRSAGRLQPLAGVWRRAALEPARRRVARGELALGGLAEDVGAEILDEEAWRAIDPAGLAFTNLNTLEDYASLRERA